MARHAPDSLEARIARWLETGVGADDVFREVALLVENRRNYLTGRFGALVADEVVDDGLRKIWAGVAAGKYDPGQSFRPWLNTVLINGCRDLGRKKGRRATLFTDIGTDDRQPDFVGESTAAPVLDTHENRRLIPEELERILAPEGRVIFAVASGIADFLELPVLQRWCLQCDAGPALFDTVVTLIAGPLHGRQVKLAAAFGLRPNTHRKRYERAAEMVARTTTIVALRKLVAAGRRAAAS